MVLEFFKGFNFGLLVSIQSPKFAIQVLVNCKHIAKLSTWFLPNQVWTKDLTLKKEIAVTDAWIYAMAADSQGRIYTSSSDGTIRCLPNPLQSDEVKELLKCGDEIESLFVDSKDNLYSGDDKGIVTMWVDQKIKFKFNLVEEVRSMAIQDNFIYSVRDNDLTITEVLEGSATGRYMTKASIPGRCPVTLCGSCTNAVHSNVAIVTRDGLGIVCIKNSTKEYFPILWTKEVRPLLSEHHSSKHFKSLMFSSTESARHDHQLSAGSERIPLHGWLRWFR